MNRRELKKRLHYSVSGAIDLIFLSADQKQAEEKTEQLLAIYEKTISEISNAKLLPDTKSRKAHFRKLKDDFNTKINQIFEGL